MEAIGFAIGVGACVLIVVISEWWDKRKEKKNQEVFDPNGKLYDKALAQVEEEMNQEQEKELEEMKGTRDLFLETLKKMGSQYELDEDNDIVFKWQGGNFVAQAVNECRFVVVYYYNWAEYELYDIDTLSRVKRTINETNCWHNMNIVYSINEAGNTFHVHTKKHFLFVSQITDIEIYLQTVLGMFYEVRRYYETELDKLKCEEEKVSL